MENINSNKQEDFNALREEAVNISNNLVNKQKQFTAEVAEILKNNDVVREALQHYGSIDETFADFRVIPWGHKNLDTWSLDISGIINSNTASRYKPMVDVLHNIEKELDTRINYIKETISSFSGTGAEAFDLIQKIHKEKNLEPLNSDDNPILEKLF